MTNQMKLMTLAGVSWPRTFLGNDTPTVPERFFISEYVSWLRNARDCIADPLRATGLHFSE
ncbi:hypothetical protein [Rhizobium mesoamericanum]|uniref:hypothetical protein n=1 Tax=Rhizobium mesoamericanum TaxID=1079800 RepID=UPI0027D92A01|nr:hypothetical protein [Rhizobium mesoamericanum]